MILSGCKKEHTMKDISILDFKNSQKIDESKIVCEICKTQNKASTHENLFYRCISCKKNICTLCKTKHDKNHDIIDYSQINYICLNHNEKFNSYCKKCKINLCMECESEHKDKQNLIYFRDILPNKDKYKSNINELKEKIDKYKDKITEIKSELDKIIINMDNIYEINNNLMKDYEKKKKNYQILCNINEISKTNDEIINDINMAINNNEFMNIINNSINIINRMGIKFNGKTISYFNENKKKEIIKNDNSENISSNSANIQKLYNDFVQKDTGINATNDLLFNKLIYVSMLSEQCSLYEDMAFFMKAFTKKKNEILTNDEMDLLAISFKNCINTYRNAIRTIDAYENKEKKKEKSLYLPYLLEYKKIVENKYYEKCKGFIDFIDENVIKKSNFKKYNEEGKIFFYKIMGDYNKYISETETFKDNKSIASKYYNESLKMANKLPIFLLLN